MSEFDAEAWERDLTENRERKDEFFAEHPQSPIPPAERESFDGLSYFPPDADYRVDATVRAHDDPETVRMETTAGPEVEYERVATFEFAIRGTDQTLAAYRQADQDVLFVPFRDKTTGQQSYEKGRYMEFEPDRDPEDGDVIPLDFNLAYAPFCAYSDTFSCPLPPEENWLDVAITAGERTYSQSG